MEKVKKADLGTEASTAIESTLVKEGARAEVAHSIDPSEFIRRGQAAIARSEADGDGIPAEQVIAKLEAKLAAARERQKQHQKPDGQ